MRKCFSNVATGKSCEWVETEGERESEKDSQRGEGKRKREGKVVVGWIEGRGLVWAGWWPIFFGFGMTMSKLNVSSVRRFIVVVVVRLCHHQQR